MSDIDFLANKKSADDQEPKNLGNKKEKIIWSEPDEDKPLLKEVPFFLLPFFGKKKEIKKPAAEQKPTIDKNKIRASRREILRLIKHNENSESKKKKNPGKGFLAGLIEKLKRQPSHKQVLIDYQQVFNREKAKRSSTADQSRTSKFNLSVNPIGLPHFTNEAGAHGKPMIKESLTKDQISAVGSSKPNRRNWFGFNKRVSNVRPAVEKKPVEIKPAHFAGPVRPIALAKQKKEPKDNFLSRFFKMIKAGIAALNRPRVKPAKISSFGNLQKIKSEIAEAEKIKPANFVGPVRPIEAPAKQKKEPKDNFLSRFFKMIKDGIAALNRPRVKPAKISLFGNLQKIKSEIAEVEKKPVEIKPAHFAGLVRPSEAPAKQVEKAAVEIKTSKKPLEPEETTRIQQEAPKVLETNLIKGEIITFFNWRKKIIILINAILIPIFIIIVIYFGFTYYEKQNQAKIQEQVKKFNKLTTEIQQQEVGLKEMVGFQTRLKTVSQIFAKHIYWTNFFKFLEDNTIKDVYYNGFVGDTGGVYSLSAVASRFSNISEQVNVFKSNKETTAVRTVGGESTAGAAGEKSKVKFDLNLSVLKSIFTE